MASVATQVPGVTSPKPYEWVNRFHSYSVFAVKGQDLVSRVEHGKKNEFFSKHFETSRRSSCKPRSILKFNHQKQVAFQAFIHEHQAPLRGFLRMLGVSPDSVDDLAQETFMIAYRELDRFDEDRDFGKWLRGIALNEVRNETRRAARRGRILKEEVTEHLLATMENGYNDERFDTRDFRALRDCLATLPEKSRQLISGRYKDEWNASILADKFEMSPTAVRLALMRIRRQLKTCIEERITNA